MRKTIHFFAVVFLMTILNSCAVPGAVVGVGGTLYGGYLEVKEHFPDQLGHLPEIPKVKTSDIKMPDITLPSFLKFGKTDIKPNSALSEKNAFGFNCTKEKNNQRQTECFNRFAKSLSNKSIKQMTNEEELAFFVNTDTTQVIKKSSQASKKPSQSNKNTAIASIKSSLQKLNKNTYKKETPTKPAQTNKPREILTTYLLNWVKAWQGQDVSSYISFYSKDFLGTKGSRSEWETHRSLALKNNSDISIEVSDVQINQKKNLVEVNFTQRFKSNKFSDVGIKELVWEKNKQGWKIIKETWAPKQKTSLRQEASQSKNFISSKVVDWANAWRDQNINLYLSFYSNEYMGTKLSRSAWEKNRFKRIKTNPNISIDISNIKFHKNKKTIKINFLQHFKSDYFSDIGIKELVWKKDNQGWKIVKESWMSI